MIDLGLGADAKGLTDQPTPPLPGCAFHWGWSGFIPMLDSILWKQSFTKCGSQALCTCRSLKGVHCTTLEVVETYTIDTPYEQRDSLKCIFHYFGGFVFVGQRWVKNGDRQGEGEERNWNNPGNSHEVFKIHFVRLDAHWTSNTACSKENSASPWLGLLTLLCPVSDNGHIIHLFQPEHHPGFPWCSIPLIQVPW